jgi:hypothetical protein
VPRPMTGRSRVRICVPDESLARFSGLAAVTELVDRLGMIDRLDATVGPIKTQDREFSAGQMLVGMAAAQLCGEDFLVELDRHRADSAGQELTPVPGLASRTAAGLARRFTEGQWAAVETGLGDVHAHALELLDQVDPDRAAALSAEVTIDMDTTDVEMLASTSRGWSSTTRANGSAARMSRPRPTRRWCWPQTSVMAAKIPARKRRCAGPGAGRAPRFGAGGAVARSLLVAALVAGRVVSHRLPPGARRRFRQHLIRTRRRAAGAVGG